MMKRILQKTTIGIAVTCILAVITFIPAYAQPAAPQTIKIGVMISLTGPDAQTGGPAKLGYELAVDKINKAGGVMVKAYGKKIPLELVMLDMETNPEKAIARAEAFNAQKVPLCVGTTLVGASAEIFEKNKLPVVASIMSINAIMDRGFKNFFNVGTLNSDIAQAVFDAFAALPKGTMPTKWAFIKEQSDFSTELFAFAKQMAAKHGITVSYEGQYAMMTPDMSALITGAKKSGAEVLFTFPTPPDAITMLKQMAQLSYKPKAVIMLRASDDPSWGKLGALGNYAIGSPDWHPALNYPGVKELNAVVKAKTGQPANPSVGPAYASIMVAASAIEKAGSLDRAAIRNALAATDMDTVVGRVKFGPHNGRINTLRPVVQWQGENMELIWPDKQKTKPFIYPIPYK
ncbi:MAG: amino acid ABC transporter substrate-binding protein [Deltaproteobacteria bacterium]|nr:amino acid ABC transporter substrate-binding protein [Deltaproteobacteria bacterium]